MKHDTVQKTRFPDFIIGGAPKCGTTTLHFILGQNPAIGIPDEEIHYFDADDPVAHPDFLFADRDGLKWYDPRPNHQQSLDWYAARFAPYRDKPVIGEDSTTYLSSASAPGRIKAMLPDVRLIFLLRNPVKRAYSQYWHLVRSARTSVSFEQALVDHPGIVTDSTYYPYLKRYLDLFGADRVQILLFEDFIADKQRFIDGVSDYIGAPRVNLDTLETWFNRTYYPSRPKAQLWLNRIGGQIVKGRYRNHMGTDTSARQQRRSKLHYRWFRYINPILLTETSQPPMREDTKQYLWQHLSARNHGLSELLDRPLGEVWQGFEG